jgi:hypothetical protein
VLLTTEEAGLLAHARTNPRRYVRWNGMGARDVDVAGALVHMTPDLVVLDGSGSHAPHHAFSRVAATFRVEHTSRQHDAGAARVTRLVPRDELAAADTARAQASSEEHHRDTREQT